VACVGLIVHQERDEASAQARELATWLVGEGHVVRVPRSDAADLGHPELAASEDTFGEGLDLVVSLGGDGSILRAVDLVAVAGVPVLGVNFGHLGYLTVIEPGETHDAIRNVLAGRYDLEERAMLSVRWAASCGPGGGPAVGVCHALNEAVLERTVSSATIRLGVTLDGEFFTTYAADGVIVATPTGSTAYAFSARGPIVATTHRSIQLTPVSPHMLFDRTMVLEPETVVRLEVRGDRPAALSVDGRRVAVLGDGDAIECTVSDRVARLVTFGPRDFHRVLKTKFGLSDR
jgi:NAD+ kinase